MASTQTTALAVPPTRPEYVRDVIAGKDIGVVQKPLTTWERLSNQNWLRKIIILVAIASAWQAYALYLNNSLLVLTFTASLTALYVALYNLVLPRFESRHDELWARR